MNPTEVVYVESHGTGTPAGDPIEAQALDEAFCKGRKGPLMTGSHKSNIGHTEAVSGMCAIAKMIIVFENGKIPPNLHYNNPNPKIPQLTNGVLKIIDKVTPLKGLFLIMNSFYTLMTFS